MLKAILIILATVILISGCHNTSNSSNQNEVSQQEEVDYTLAINENFIYKLNTVTQTKLSVGDDIDIASFTDQQKLINFQLYLITNILGDNYTDIDDTIDQYDAERVYLEDSILLYTLIETIAVSYGIDNTKLASRISYLLHKLYSVSHILHDYSQYIADEIDGIKTDIISMNDIDHYMHSINDTVSTITNSLNDIEHNRNLLQKSNRYSHNVTIKATDKGHSYTLMGVTMRDKTNLLIYLRQQDSLVFDDTKNSVYGSHPLRLSSVSEDSGTMPIANLLSAEGTQRILKASDSQHNIIYPYCQYHGGMYKNKIIIVGS